MCIIHNNNNNNNIPIYHTTCELSIVSVLHRPKTSKTLYIKVVMLITAM